MKPRIKIAEAHTPDGSQIELRQHDKDFFITVNGQDLMNSRQHESELELARLGCAAAVALPEPRVLIGGLGMGFTLRQALDMFGPTARIVVSELLDAVVEWNNDYLGQLNNYPVKDKRVELKRGNVVKLIRESHQVYDAILLDVDNGPGDVTDSGNSSLYSRHGLETCKNALKESGCLAIWSSEPSKSFEQLLMKSGFLVRRYRAGAYKGSKALSRFIFVASEDKNSLPPGGGELIRKKSKRSSRGRRH